MAPVFNVDPHIALAVASVESNLNPHAIGGHGEVGLFQVMPAQFKKRGYTRKQMEMPLNNIYVGLQMIAEARKSCIHKGAIHSLVCYNAGPTVAKKIKNPSKFAYVKKVTKKLLTILSTGK